MASPYDALLQTLGQQQQGLAGLGSDPLFGMGIGLLSGSMQGAPGRGLQVGLQNMLQIERANQSTALLGLRIKEMQEARQQAAEQRAAQQQLFADPRAALAAQAGQMDIAKALEFPKPPTMTNLQREAAALYPNDPAAQQQFIEQVRLKPETQVNVGGAPVKPTFLTPEEKVQAGIPPTQPAYYSKQGEIKVPPAASTAEAAILSGVKAAKEDIKTVKEVFKPGGEWSDKAILSSGFPRTEGARAQQAMRRSIETLLRIRTGAAAPQQEVDSYMAQFMPSSFDSDQAKEDKMQAFESFMENISAEMGRTKPQPPPGWEVIE